MRRIIPTITKRVVGVIAMLVVGLVTNAWHKNQYSGTMASIAAVALAVWLGLQIGSSE